MFSSTCTSQWILTRKGATRSVWGFLHPVIGGSELFVGGGPGTATGAGRGGGRTHRLGGASEHRQILVYAVILGHLLLGVVYPHGRGRSVGVAVRTDGACGVWDPVSVDPLFNRSGPVCHVTGGLLEGPGVHLVLSIVVGLSRWSGVLVGLRHVSGKVSKIVAVCWGRVAGLEHVGVLLTQNHLHKFSHQ